MDTRVPATIAPPGRLQDESDTSRGAPIPTPGAPGTTMVPTKDQVLAALIRELADTALATVAGGPKVDHEARTLYPYGDTCATVTGCGDPDPPVSTEVLTVIGPP